jgi:hypothetical protein
MIYAASALVSQTVDLVVFYIIVLTRLLFKRLTAFGDNTPGISVSVLIMPRSVPETMK